MSDIVAPSSRPATPTTTASDSPKLKQKWTSRVGTVVRRASQRLSIHKIPSHDQSPDKTDKTRTTRFGSVDLNRTSTSTSSASTSKSFLATRHVKSESAPTGVVVVVPSSSATEPAEKVDEGVVSVSLPTDSTDPSTTPGSTLQDSTILDKSMVIVPLAATPTETPVPAVSPPGHTEEVPETHTHILLPPSSAEDSDDSPTVNSASLPEPVLVQIELDDSMVEVVIPLEEEEDDAAAPPLPLNVVPADSEERVEELEESDKGVRFADEVYVIESETTQDQDDIREITEGTDDMVVIAVPEVVETNTSAEDQHLLDSTIVPREEDTISILEHAHRSEIIIEIPNSTCTKAHTATVTLLSGADATREEPSSSSSSSASDKPSQSHAVTVIFALISGAIVGVGALAYAGVIAGLSVGGIVAGVGGSIVTGWRGRRNGRA